MCPPILPSQYLDGNVVDGTTYYYVVTAVDISSNESGYSNEESATPGVLSPEITIQEYQTGLCSFDGDIETEHSGYTGEGYINTDNASGNGIDYRVNILASGTYTFIWRFANGSSDRPARLLINGSQELSSINFPATGAWTTWSEVSAQVDLTTGEKDVRLEATSSGGLANIDYMNVTGQGIEQADCQ